MVSVRGYEMNPALYSVSAVFMVLKGDIPNPVLAACPRQRKCEEGGGGMPTGQQPVL